MPGNEDEAVALVDPNLKRATALDNLGAVRHGLERLSAVQSG
jgi:hypothetical protein